MCFSAQASFVGSVILLGIGTVTLRHVHKPSQLVFASIPLFFGIQQFMEGMLWVTLPHPELAWVQQVCTVFFLIMACVVWPVMVPLSVLLMEKNAGRKRILWGLFCVGLVMSIYYAICLMLFKVSAHPSYYHIQYWTEFNPYVEMVNLPFYLLVTVAPLLISSIKRTHLLGIFMFISCMISLLFFSQFLTSVWCFFAAINSGIIFWILRDGKRNILIPRAYE
jgi:hypothetical protein